MKKKVAFICVHNSCRSQIAEALGKHLASEVFEIYSAGTETKSQIKPRFKKNERNMLFLHLKDFGGRMMLRAWIIRTNPLLTGFLSFVCWIS